MLYRLIAERHREAPLYLTRTLRFVRLARTPPPAQRFRTRSVSLSLAAVLFFDNAASRVRRSLEEIFRPAPKKKAPKKSLAHSSPAKKHASTPPAHSNKTHNDHTPQPADKPSAKARCDLRTAT